jgi:hypothetical protein
MPLRPPKGLSWPFIWIYNRRPPFCQAWPGFIAFSVVTVGPKKPGVKIQRSILRIEFGLFGPALPGPDDRTHFGERFAKGPTNETVAPQAHTETRLKNNPMVNQPVPAPAMKAPDPPAASWTAGPRARLKIEDDGFLPDLKTLQIPPHALSVENSEDTLTRLVMEPKST